MSRKAKHHFIPRCYLKQFTDGGQNNSPFWAIPNDGKAFKTNPNDACAIRDYYTVEHHNPLIVEDFYAEKIEPKILEVIKYINDNSCLPPKVEAENLSLFLATLYLRVPSFRENIKEFMESSNNLINDISEQDCKILNKEELLYTKNDLILSEIRMLSFVQECLSKKYYQLHIIRDDAFDVITSDTPFMLNHALQGSGTYFGLNTPGVCISVPLTSKAILIGRNEKALEGTFTASKSLIAQINTNIVMSANQFIYTKNNQFLIIDENNTPTIHKIKTKYN